MKVARKRIGVYISILISAEYSAAWLARLLWEQ